MSDVTPVTREAAIKQAEKMRKNHREVCRVMMPHADEEKLWEESTDTANVMARYIIQPPAPASFDAREFVDLCMKEGRRIGDLTTPNSWKEAVVERLAAELTAELAAEKLTPQSPSCPYESADLSDAIGTESDGSS